MVDFDDFFSSISISCLIKLRRDFLLFTSCFHLIAKKDKKSAFIIINVSMSLIYVLPYKTFIASHDKAQGKRIVKFKHPVQKLYFIKDQHLNLKIMNI